MSKGAHDKSVLDVAREARATTQPNTFLRALAVLDGRGLGCWALS